MPTIGEQIITQALVILKDHPDGVRYANLLRQLAEPIGTFKNNTVQGNIWDLDIKHPDKVYKPARGLFRLVEFREQDGDQLRQDLVPKPPPKVREADFYQPFAEWLVRDLEDCTLAVPLGGNKFGDKWGTPDVIGKRESKRSDILQAPTEVVSAEIKLDTVQLVTAFGQACAYLLFSHKSYLVVPKTAPQDELGRLDSLCQIFGIGLILFDPASPEDPEFDIRVRPRKQDPEIFYTNKYLKLIEKELFP